jgi:pimeloyl-ACP methyl ester carboxylesterase
MIEDAFFLCGDAFPNDIPIDTELRMRLASSFSRWVGWQEILEATGRSEMPGEFGERASLFQAYAERHGEMNRAVLFGRSSGARLATLYASRNPVRAVVCVAYPFHYPGREVEPERFAHLAHLLVPTLIFQGTSDPMGGLNVVKDYALSPLVTVEFLETDHTCSLSDDAWNSVAQTIRDFFARSGVDLSV